MTIGKTAVDELGGITWTQPIEVLKDASLPPIYAHRRSEKDLWSDRIETEGRCGDQTVPILSG